MEGPGQDRRLIFLVCRYDAVSSFPRRRESRPGDLLKIFRQISPIRIFLLDLIEFPGAGPFLHLFLSRDRRNHVVVPFVINEKVDPMSFCKPFDKSFFVLPNPLLKVACDTDVNSTVPFASQNVRLRLVVPL